MGMRAPMMVLASACVVIGIAPGLVWLPVLRAVGSWNPEWTTAAMPFTTLGPVQCLLAILCAAAVFFLWQKSRANGVRRSLTWDCGYHTPTPHMQYTSGSFAGIPGGWFFWIFQPTRKFRRPRGPFPAAALRLDRVPETVLERLIQPVGVFIEHLANAALGLQHGRVQSYILYLVAGLAALGAYVFLGGIL